MSAQVKPPIPTRASKVRVHAFAEQVAQHLSFNPGDPIEPVVARLGGTILYDSPPLSAGTAPESIVVESERNFTIFLPSTTSPQRDRFTISHELGHLFLHYPMVQKAGPGSRMIATRWVDEGNAEQQRAEWEANWFAAGFLMPETVFRAQWHASGNVFLPRTMRMAKFFDLSESAIEIRAKSLALT